MSTHFIPSQVVKETEAELKVPSRDNSFRNRLLEFIGLYKFVVDTLVKRKMTDATARAKVDHNYNQLTPEAARGATVRFKIRGSDVCFISPSFKNTRYMINDEYLAVIMLMKVRRDPFFLWLLALFSGGALAPTSAAASTTANRMSVAPTSRAANERMGRKRQRESPPKARVSSGAAGGSAGGGLGGGSGTGSGAAASGGLGGGSSGGTGGAARGASAGGVSGSSGDGYGRAIGGRGSGSLDERGRGGSDGGASGAANQGSDSNACGSTESNTQAGGVNAAVGGADGSSSADAGVSGSADRAGDFPVTAASQQPADAANALVKRVGASFLTVDGKRAATAELLLDLTMYHGVDIPPTVVTVFLQAIEHGSEDVVYPFGQDAQLCLVSGNPSPTPVTLGSIAAGYRSVWSVSSIGPRVRLFDRPPQEQGSVLLATACVWRVAPPDMAALAAREAESGGLEAGQRTVVLAEMPAVEVFGMVYANGQREATYPFMYFYESTAYSQYRKHHFPDFMLPTTMEDAMAVESLALARRSLVLWNALYTEG